MKSKIGNYANYKKRKLCKLKREMKKNPTAMDLTIAKMPPLRHAMLDEPFDIRRSEVAKWLCRQPSVMQWTFDRAKDRGAIVYDETTGTWQGVNYEG